MNLTPEGLKTVEEIAARHQVSVDAVKTLLQALINGGGTMAQFNHPEFGGSGQWMQGGMTMVGDMFNYGLKAKVDNLCSELAALLVNQPLFAQPSAVHPQGQGTVDLFVAATGGQWWPEELGAPSSTGSQDNLRYAVFNATRRLAIEIDGQKTIYDTLNHQIGGVSQQQGSGASLTFTSQFGTVRLADLPVVSGHHAVSSPDFQTNPAVSAVQQSSDTEVDIFTKIERLAELRQKGFLSDEEFASKKSELMSRL